MLYLSSTSNHNISDILYLCGVLCYIFLLHQTTTFAISEYGPTSCVISFFYIKPQHLAGEPVYGTGCVISFFYIKPQLAQCLNCRGVRCVISFFYIKPQPIVPDAVYSQVVLYLSSTSNHNTRRCWNCRWKVVLYLSSTSNHNTNASIGKIASVVLYLSSTSNHNRLKRLILKQIVVLYLSSTSNHNAQGLRLFRY